MRNVSVLVTAIETVEEYLKEPMSAGDLARACHSSCSGLQKLFTYAFSCSVKEYIIKRRLTRASHELLASSESITNIAFDYQYSSSEAFSRAFKRFWGISPSEFRKTRRFTELLPKFALNNDEGEAIMSKRKPVDVSALYDELKKLRGSYVLGIDIVEFDKVNKNFGYAAGDLVLAEAFARLERELGENMLLFRIGGDEFAVVTGYSSTDDAEALARRITAHNGEAVKSGVRDIPLSLRVGISCLAKETPNYRDTLEIMYKAMDKAEEAVDNVAIYTE